MARRRRRRRRRSLRSRAHRAHRGGGGGGEARARGVRGGGARRVRPAPNASDGVVGNAALAVADLAKETALLPALEKLKPVAPLLRACHSRTGAAQKNAAIACARLAHHPRCSRRSRKTTDWNSSTGTCDREPRGRGAERGGKDETIGVSHRERATGMTRETTQLRRGLAPTFVDAIRSPVSLVSSRLQLTSRGHIARVFRREVSHPAEERPCDRSNRAAFSAVKCSPRAGRDASRSRADFLAPVLAAPVARSASAPGSAASLAVARPSRIARVREVAQRFAVETEPHAHEFESRSVRERARIARIEHPGRRRRQTRGAIGQTPTRGCPD